MAPCREPDIFCEFSSALFGGRRGEDRIVTMRLPWRLAGHEAHLFAVFDGHGGSLAARCAAAEVAPVLEALLQPLARSPAAGPCQLATQLQQALVLACLQLHCQFAVAGSSSGCTAVLALQAGRLLTVASLGSSQCALDTGAGQLVTLSQDHRINNNPQERSRLVAAGCCVAPMDGSSGGPAASPVAAIMSGSCGPLRLWPGGLTLSRSIGDFPIGEAVLPLPHITQVLLPPSGARLVLATDGVWSQAEPRLAQLLHSAPVKTAAAAAMRQISMGRHSEVDAGLIVAEMLPPRESWAAVSRREKRAAAAPAPAAGPRRGERGGRLLRCFGLRRPKTSPSADRQAAGAPQQPAQAQLLADYDSAALLGLVPYSNPACQPGLNRGSSGSSGSGSGSSSGSTSWGSEACQEGLREGSWRGGSGAPLDQRGGLPDWCDELTEAELCGMLLESHQAWRAARCAGVATPAADGLPWGAAQPSWLEAGAAAAAAAAAAGGAPPPATPAAAESPSQSIAARSPFAASPHAPPLQVPQPGAAGLPSSGSLIPSSTTRSTTRSSLLATLTGGTAGGSSGGGQAEPPAPPGLQPLPPLPLLSRLSSVDRCSSGMEPIEEAEEEGERGGGTGSSAWHG